jgi:hypothetical protein
LHEDDRGHVRQDVATEDPALRGSQRHGPGDELLLANGQGARPHHERELRRIDERERRHDVDQAGAEEGNQEEREEQPRERQRRIRHPCDQVIQPPPPVPGPQPEPDADHPTRGDGEATHGQRDPRPVDQAAQDISPQGIGTKQMPSLRWAEPRPHVRLQGVVRGDVRRQDRGRPDHRHHGGAYQEHASDPQEAAQARPPSRGLQLRTHRRFDSGRAGRHTPDRFQPPGSSSRRGA